MQVLVIGASGLVGGACFKVLSLNKKFNVKGTYRNFTTEKNRFIHFDPMIEESLELLLEKWDAVIHTGALTHVDLCETEIEKSYAQTVHSTDLIIAALKQNNPAAHFIYISTDYVFDGANGPYSENALTNPLNVYGKHKLEAENLALGMRHSAVIRVTNVYGEEERNKNFVSRLIKQLQLNESAILKAPVDQFATPVNAIDIAKMIEIIIEQKAVGIFHAAGYDYYNRYQLIQKGIVIFS